MISWADGSNKKREQNYIHRISRARTKIREVGRLLINSISSLKHQLIGLIAWSLKLPTRVHSHTHSQKREYAEVGTCQAAVELDNVAATNCNWRSNMLISADQLLTFTASFECDITAFVWPMAAPHLLGNFIQNITASVPNVWVCGYQTWRFGNITQTHRCLWPFCSVYIEIVDKYQFVSCPA